MYNVDELVKDLIGKDVTLCRDYPSILKWSVEKIEKWTDSWTDYTITDPGILFINADAFLYDIVNYILDEAFLNNILRYTQSMQSLVSMSKFAGLTLPGYYSSEAKCVIYNDADSAVEIPRDFGIFVRDEATNEMLYFYTLSGAKFSPHTKGSLQCIEGERTVVDTTFSEFFDHPNFEFVIPDPTIGLNAIFVYGEYEFDGGKPIYCTDDPTLRKLLQVDDALLNLATEPCFSAYYAYNKVVIQLCPGAADFFSSGSRIKIVYGASSGVKGNIGTVQAKPRASVYDVEGLNVSNKITFTIEYAAGASEPYDLESTRVFIGNNVWRPETLILNADFDNLMNSKFNEIVRFTVCQEKGSEDMLVYYVPAETDFEGKPMTNARIAQLQEEIYDYAKDLMFGSVKLTLKNSSEFEIDFVIEVYLNTNTSDTDSIYDNMITVLKSYFDRTKQPRNFYFRRGHVITLLETSIPEIYSVELTYPVADLQAADDQLFVLGNVVANFKQNNEFAEWS